MANTRLSMRKVREILRLRHEAGLSVRDIARSLGISVGVVQNYLHGAAKAGLGWLLAGYCLTRPEGRLPFAYLRNSA